MIFFFFVPYILRWEVRWCWGTPTTIPKNLTEPGKWRKKTLHCEFLQGIKWGATGVPQFFCPSGWPHACLPAGVSSGILREGGDTGPTFNTSVLLLFPHVELFIRLQALTAVVMGQYLTLSCLISHVGRVMPPLGTLGSTLMTWG